MSLATDILTIDIQKRNEWIESHNKDIRRLKDEITKYETTISRLELEIRGLNHAIGYLNTIPNVK